MKFKEKQDVMISCVHVNIVCDILANLSNQNIKRFEGSGENKDEI